MSPLPDDVLEFLHWVVPGHSDRDLNAAFGQVFEQGAFGKIRPERILRDHGKGTQPRNDMRSLRRVVKKISAHLSKRDNEEMFALTDAVFSEVPDDIRKRLEQDLLEDGETARTPDLWASRLNDELRYEEIFSENYSCAGGTQPEADMIAESVKVAFEDLRLRATFGIDANKHGRPSTAFGRVVEEALDFHGSNVDWRQPCRRAADAPARKRS